MIKNTQVFVDTLNEAITTSVINVAKTCSAVANNRVSIRVKRVGGNVTIGGEVSQEARSDLKCEQSSDIQAALKSELVSAVKAEAKSTDMSWLSGDFGIFSNTQAFIDTTNRSIMNSDINDVMSCYNTANNEYNLEFGTIEGDFSYNTKVDQSARANVLSCVQRSSTSANMINQLTSTVDAAISNRGTLADLADTMSGVIMIAIVASIISCIVLAVVKLKGKKSKPEAPTLGNLVKGALATAQKAMSNLPGIAGVAAGVAAGAAKSAAASVTTTVGEVSKKFN
jgi:hypothetical protein